MLNNKRAQMGETMTWIVATIIIFVFLLIFIYSSSALGELRVVSITQGSYLDYPKSLLGFEGTDVIRDVLETKTEIALIKNSLNENKIREWIDEK